MITRLLVRMLLVAATLGSVLPAEAAAQTDHLRLGGPGRAGVGSTFTLTLSGRTSGRDRAWVYFSERRCAKVAHKEAVEGYPVLNRRVGPGRFHVRSRRIARKAGAGYYCAYLYPQGASATRKPNARASRKIIFAAPQIPPQGRRPVGHNADGRQQLYLIDTSGRLMTRYQLAPNGKWSSWKRLSGTWPPSDAIGLGTNRNGTQQLYLIGSDGKLWTTSQRRPDTQRWAKWTSLGTPAGVSWAPGAYIAVGAQADGRQQVYVAAEDGVYTRRQAVVNGRWRPGWMSLGGAPWPAGEGIGVGRNADGRQAIYLVDGGLPLYMNFQTHAESDSWYGWVYLAGTWNVPSDVAVGADADGRQALFLVGLDTQIYTQDQLAPNGGWSGGWTTLGSPDTASFPPEAHIGIGRNQDGRQQLHVVADDRQMYVQDQGLGGTWAGTWTTLGQPHGTDFPPANSIGVGRNKDGRDQIYIVGADGVLYSKTQVAANSSQWSPEWASLGGEWPPQ